MHRQISNLVLFVSRTICERKSHDLRSTTVGDGHNGLLRGVHIHLTPDRSFVVLASLFSVVVELKSNFRKVMLLLKGSVAIAH